VGDRRWPVGANRNREQANGPFLGHNTVFRKSWIKLPIQPKDYSPYTLVPTYQTLRCHYPEDHNLNNDRREKLKTYNASLSRSLSVISSFHFCHKASFCSRQDVLATIDCDTVMESNHMLAKNGLSPITNWTSNSTPRISGLDNDCRLIGKPVPSASHTYNPPLLKSTLILFSRFVHCLTSTFPTRILNAFISPIFQTICPVHNFLNFTVITNQLKQRSSSLCNISWSLI
jgi:hypothetical protein